MPLFYFLWNYFDQPSAPVKCEIKDLENIPFIFRLTNFCLRVCFNNSICFFNLKNLRLKITCFVIKKKI